MIKLITNIKIERKFIERETYLFVRLCVGSIKIRAQRFVKFPGNLSGDPRCCFFGNVSGMEGRFCLNELYADYTVSIGVSAFPLAKTHREISFSAPYLSQLVHN